MPDRTSAMSDKPYLTARVPSVSRSGSSLLENISLDLHRGEMVWIQGESGSGKSTLLASLAALLPHSGDLVLDGKSFGETAPEQWRSKVSLCRFPPVSLCGTIREELLFPFTLSANASKSPPTEETLGNELEALGLGGYGLDYSPSRLSQGQLSRIAFLRTLLTGPEVLLLDEPTANLDETAAGRLRRRCETFASAGAIIVIAAHGEPWPTAARRYEIRSGHLGELQ